MEINKNLIPKDKPKDKPLKVEMIKPKKYMRAELNDKELIMGFYSPETAVEASIDKKTAIKLAHMILKNFNDYDEGEN